MNKNENLKDKKINEITGEEYLEINNHGGMIQIQNAKIALIIDRVQWMTKKERLMYIKGHLKLDNLTDYDAFAKRNEKCFSNWLRDNGGLGPEYKRLNTYKPTEDVVISFDDKTGEKRSEETIDKMIEEMRVIANKYDFDYSNSGNPESFYRMLQLIYKGATKTDYLDKLPFKVNYKGNDYNLKIFKEEKFWSVAYYGLDEKKERRFYSSAKNKNDAARVVCDILANYLMYTDHMKIEDDSQDIHEKSVL